MQAAVPQQESFIVVCGPKGVGKTTAVQTAMADISGLIYISVELGLDAIKIRNQARVELL